MPLLQVALAVLLWLFAPTPRARAQEPRPATTATDQVLAPTSLARRTLPAPRPTASERTLAAAELALASGQPARAERRLLTALLRDPRDARVLARYATLVVPLAAEPARPLVQRVQGARALLARIARRDALPGDPSVYPEPEIERAIALHAALAEALLEHDESSFALVRAAGRQQDLATVACLRQIAALAVARDRLELAEQALALARQYYLQDLALSSELGHVLLARGRGEAALRVFGERYAIDPSQLEARRDLAYALASEGRAGEALALLSSDRDACERDLGCALEASRVALEAGRPEDALRYAAKRLAADAGDLDALFVTADAHTRAGQLAEARRSYERALEVRPDSARARAALAELAELPASNDSAH